MGRDPALMRLTPDTFLCSICLEFPVQPAECQTCDSLFCSECLEKWILTNYSHCPSMCPNPVYKKVSHTLDKILRNIPTQCKHTGCEVVKPICEIASHEEHCRWRVMETMEIDRHFQHSHSFHPRLEPSRELAEQEYYMQPQQVVPMQAMMSVPWIGPVMISAPCYYLPQHQGVPSASIMNPQMIQVSAAPTPSGRSTTTFSF